MTYISLAPAYQGKLRTAATPLSRKILNPAGAHVILGNQVAANGLPDPVAPRPTTMFGPRGVCFAPAGNFLFVSDTGHHRLLFWRGIPAEDNAPADFFIGQPDFFSEGRNGHGEIGAATLNMPTGIATDGNVFAVADAWNHRILIWHGLPEYSNQPADIVLGQEDFRGGIANRGLPGARADTLNWCYGVTISEGRLYVADTGNRRVLIWNSIPARPGQPADLVLGQQDMATRDDNAGGPGGAVGMRWPHSIAIEAGKILVADAGNNRIMAWNGMPNADGAPCSFVLGQATLEGIDHNRAGYYPDERALNMPYGLAVHDGQVICTDTANSRIVSYPFGRLEMDVAATGLAGQNSFVDKGDNRWRFATRDSLCWPFGLAASDRYLAVADSGNNRVLLWETAE